VINWETFAVDVTLRTTYERHNYVVECCQLSHNIWQLQLVWLYSSSFFFL